MAKRKAIEHVTVEGAALRVDVRETTALAHTAGQRLSHVGERAAEAAHELYHDARGDELRSGASELRSAAVHALALAAELMACAGRLEQTASVYEASGATSDDL